MSLPIPGTAFTVVLLALACTQAANAQSKCERRTPEDVRLLIKARDANGTLAALRCRKELTADSLVRGNIGNAFTSEAFESNRDFLGLLRKSGVDFLLEFAPLTPEDQRDNHVTPLGAAFQTANLEAVKWLLAGSKPISLRAYRRLAYTAVEPLLGQTTFDEPRLRLLEIIRISTKAGLPLDADQHRAYRDALLTWWRTQDSIDYTDNSSSARFGSRPLPAAGAPLWREITETLAPTDAEIRHAVNARVAEQYLKYHLGDIDHKIEALKNGLAGARPVPGAMVVDTEGMLATSPYGRVSKESVLETLAKLEARGKKLRSILMSQTGGNLPDWARPAVGQGEFGEIFGLRLGTRLADLFAGNVVPPSCGQQAAAQYCVRTAAPILWEGEPKLAARVDVGGRFPVKGATPPRIDPMPDFASANPNGVVRIELPATLVQPGWPTFVDAEVRDGVLQAVYFQGAEQQVAKELRRLWGDESASFTEWVRLSKGGTTRQAVGTVYIPGVGSGTVYENREFDADDRPIAHYRWQNPNGYADMRCAGGCNAEVRWASSPRSTGVGAGVPAGATAGRALVAPATAPTVGTTATQPTVVAATEPATSALPARSPDSPSSDISALRAQIGREYWQKIVAELPKPAGATGQAHDCNTEELLEDNALPSGGPQYAAAEARNKAAVVGQVSFWARQYALFRGQGECVNAKEAAKLWQSAIGSTQTGKLTRSDVERWQELRNAAMRKVPRPESDPRWPRR